MKLLKTSTVVLLCLFFLGTFIPEASARRCCGKRHHKRNRTAIGLNLNLGAPSTTYVATPAIVPPPVLVAPAPLVAAPAYPYAAPAYPYHYSNPYPTYYQAPAPLYSYYQAPAPVVIERQPFIQSGISFSFRR